MSNKNIYFKKPFTLILSFLLIWIILFQFVLEQNSFLPKPLIVYNSLSDLLNIYQLPSNFFFSLGAIVFSIIISVLLLYFFKYYLLTQNIISEFILSIYKLKYFIPGILIGIFLIFWFPHSIYIEYIFLTISSFIYLSGLVINEKDKLGNEYVISLKSLGVKDNKNYAAIKFKQLLPLLENSLIIFHLKLWAILITFEYIQNAWGLGTIINNSIQYRDLSTLFSVSLLICLTIISGNYILKFLFNRFVYWE
ncbi:MAG: ABC transporter permease subunit [Bacteroidetes bacterium]|nr:ABC transporter permease subunit [Bacteroidota bacterium]